MPIWAAVTFSVRHVEEDNTPIVLDSRRNDLSWNVWLGSTKEEATQKAVRGRNNFGMPGNARYKILVGQLTEMLQEEQQQQPEPEQPPEAIEDIWARYTTEFERALFHPTFQAARRQPDWNLADDAPGDYPDERG